jgi:hypothetical protein
LSFCTSATARRSRACPAVLSLSRNTGFVRLRSTRRDSGTAPAALDTGREFAASEVGSLQSRFAMARRTGMSKYPAWHADPDELRAFLFTPEAA